MGTPRENLHATLEQLHRQLSELTDVDVQVADELRSALRDLQATLSRASSRPATAEPGALRDWAVRFEETHPSVSLTLGRLADLLGQMGI